MNCASIWVNVTYMQELTGSQQGRPVLVNIVLAL